MMASTDLSQFNSNSNMFQQLMQLARACSPELDAALGDDPEIGGFEHDSDRIPLPTALRQLQQVIRFDRDGHLGLEVGSAFKPGNLGLCGFACMFCDTLGDAVKLMLKYQPLRLQICSMGLQEFDEHAILTSETAITGDAAHFIEVCAWAACVRFGGWLTWKPALPLKRIAFCRPEPANPDQYEAFFNCEVLFNAPRAAIWIDRSILDLPLQHANPFLRGQLIRVLDLQLTMLQSERYVTLQVLGYLGQRMGAEKPTLNAVADALGMSERSLKRRLHQESTSYSSLLAEVRCDLASFYLTATDMSLVDIAHLLGFVDQSAFTRAFKSWKGVTPAAFRRKQSTGFMSMSA